MPGAEAKRHAVQCASPSGLHRISYLEWGDRANPRVLVCVHGLTRSGRDFDFLARALCAEYRVICPDLAGRGESEWLKNPMEYVVPAYVADMVTLIARLDVESVDWVGTSLGGMVGMALASLPESPIRKLVLNDVGPVLAADALKRIADYVGKAPPFPSVEAADAYIRAVSASFGPHTDAEWRFLTENMLKRDAAGGWRLHYDPAISVAFAAQAKTAKDVDIWPIYDAIRCPTLLLRGKQSDLLSEPVAKAMEQRGPKASRVEFDGVGHAPTLIHADQISPVREFLLQS
jgi:pimeloyl-ACP methyl ester carboxylesterase